MAVAVSSLFKCVLKNSPAMALSRRGLISFIPRLASINSLELKPLRTINRSIGSSRPSKAPEAAAAAASGSESKQFPRPGTVAYNRSLANSINLIGNVGVDPDIVYHDSGEIVATSSLSVKKTLKGEPSWYFLEFQSDLAEIASQHIRKGDRVHVAGRVFIEMVSIADGEPKEQKLVKVAVTELHFVDDVYGAQAVPATSSASGAQAVPATSSASTQTPKRTQGSTAEKRQAAEKLWKVFFENPSTWYDNRVGKRNPKAPDFKHKTTGDALWIDGYYVPTFVKDKITELEDEGVLPRVDGGSSSPSSSNTSSSSPSSSNSSSSISTTTEYNPF